MIQNPLDQPVGPDHPLSDPRITRVSTLIGVVRWYDHYTRSMWEQMRTARKSQLTPIVVEQTRRLNWLLRWQPWMPSMLFRFLGRRLLGAEAYRAAKRERGLL